MPGDRLTGANIKPRLRMTTLYAFANHLGYRVVGTGNRSELAIGYFTKWGDGGVDLLPLGNLTKTRVRELARHLGVPQRIIDKPPSAGLWEGQTDESEMGVTYEQLDAYLEGTRRRGRRRHGRPAPRREPAQARAAAGRAAAARDGRRRLTPAAAPRTPRPAGGHVAAFRRRARYSVHSAIGLWLEESLVHRRPEVRRHVGRQHRAHHERGAPHRRHLRRRHSVCAVVSARGDTTDELLEMAHEITARPPERELDMLLSTGERISCALLAMAIHTLGREAVSFTGSQAGIVTDTTHTKAKIVGISPKRIEEALAEGKIALVAGFQGVSTAKDVTTLGRGGSDTTAVALAHALGADVCEIYTDVDGVYTTNPNLVPEARKLDRVSYEEMLEMAASGAQVLALRSVEYARKYGVVIHCRSSFSDGEGTWVREEDETMEQAIVSGVTYTTDEAKVTVRGVPDQPGVAAHVFAVLADAHVNVDMIIQNVGDGGHSDISCTVPIDDLDAARVGARPHRRRARRQGLLDRRDDGQDQPHRRRHADPPRRRRARCSAPSPIGASTWR